MPSNDAKTHAGATHSHLDDAVIAEQIRLLARNRIDLPINLLNAAIVSGVLWPLYPRWAVMAWLGLFTLVILARALVRRRYRTTETSPATALPWARRFGINAFATGCLWGLTASVVLVTPNPVYHIFIVFVLGGMMAGGIVTNSSYMPAMLAFMLPTILPVIALLISRPGFTQIEMGVMLAAFAVVLIIAGRNINHSIVENFHLRIEQDLLLNKLRASESVLANAQELAQVGSWDIDLVAETYECSMEAYRIFGVDPAKMKPTYRAMLARIHPDDQRAVQDDIANTVLAGQGLGTVHRLLMDDGTIKYVHELGRVTCDPAGRPLRMIGTVQDITRRRLADDELKFANILLNTEMEASPDGILVVDASRRIISFNQRFADIWKIPATDLAAGNDAVVLAKVTSTLRDPERFSTRVRYLYDHPGEDSHDEYVTTDGRVIDRYTRTLTTPGGKYLGRVWFFRDITESKQIAARALRLAHFDVLTGLANRSVFVEALQQAIKKISRGEKGFAVIYLDLDHFKDVNDTLGHAVGDALLQAVADRLQANTRESDTVARFGGDEFAVIVGNVAEPADAAILADKLINVLGELYSIQGNQIYSGASIGIDLYGPEAHDAETLLSHADVALYRAKSEGRGRYRFFTDAMDAEVRMTVALGAELHEALSSDQLFLLYQPQGAIDSGRVTGVEALVRWRHPVRGILGPEIFVPVAENTGLIGRLGNWVLLTACLQAKQWLDSGVAPGRIAVNLSGIQFKSPIALEANIVDILAKTGLPPRLLELELTETVLMTAMREHSEILTRLQHLGVTIAIDDFGTGYSSLDYLRRFPVDRIKIAQTFVRHLETMPGDASIVKATIGLARELGIKVIAEGVETREQLELLKRWGCGEMQGYYFAKPLTVKEITVLLVKGGILLPYADQSSEATPDRSASTADCV